MRSITPKCRQIKRCLLFFLAIALLPMIVIYFMVDDQVRARTINHISRGGASNFTSLVWHWPQNQPLTKEELQQIEDRMQNRIERLNEKCLKHNLNVRGNDSMHKPNAWEFLVSRKHHIIWCNVFKAASSSWMYNFNILAGYSPMFLKKTNIVPLNLARRKYPRVSFQELERAQNDSTTFLIVRHPFERLLSAYRDKFMHAVPHSYHDKLGNDIIRRYRKAKPTEGKLNCPTFAEFVDYLLDEDGRHALLDMHWTPIAKFCTPCQIHFDIIAKFETLDEDQRYIIRQTSLGRFISPQWKNSGKGHKSADLNRKYFDQLSTEQIDGLYRIFRYDFELFDYSMDAYARSNQDNKYNVIDKKK